MKKILILCALIGASGSFNALAGGDIAKGQELATKLNCASCHGKDFNTPIDPTYPKLAGQHKDYLEQALVAYKRGNGPNGRVNPIMGSQVQALKRQDMKDIAAYLHSLPGTLVLKR
jgi:cytochrome c553